MSKMKHSATAASVSLLFVGATLAEASDGAGFFLAAGSRGVPLWPIYLALAIGAAIACYQCVRYFLGREPKAKVFPKLGFRRRLFAPYSGGNHAAVEFGSGQDNA